MSRQIDASVKPKILGINIINIYKIVFTNITFFNIQYTEA